ncbi:MAG: porin family protein [Rhodomicrobium sp.]|nr:porin family protein [Rhodomicrobium sp.]
MSNVAAGDMSLKDGYAPAPIWTGYYAGGHVGGLWNDEGDSSLWKKKRNYETKSYSWDNKTDYAEFGDDDDDVSLIAGVHVGYNWQSGNKVLGIEADISFGDDIDYLASLRGRLGYAHGNLLLYVTAGAAFVGFDDTKITTTYYSKSHDSEFEGDRKIGVVAGGGAEYKIAPNWSVGAEGLYYAFADTDSADDWYWGRRKYKLEHEDDNDLLVVRGRITYHFTDDRQEPLK